MFFARSLAGMINGENIDRGSSDRCYTDGPSLTPTEMSRPIIRARIEQPGELSSGGIDSREIGSLVPVAAPASQGEIFQHRLPLCCREMMSSTTCRSSERISGKWQYSHCPLARSH